MAPVVVSFVMFETPYTILTLKLSSIWPAQCFYGRPFGMSQCWPALVFGYLCCLEANGQWWICLPRGDCMVLVSDSGRASQQWGQKLILPVKDSNKMLLTQVWIATSVKWIEEVALINQLPLEFKSRRKLFFV